VGTIHNRLQVAAEQAAAINQSQNLSAIDVGLHDEIYQSGRPVLVGVDARSAICWQRLKPETKTPGLSSGDDGARLNPEYTIADAARTESRQKAAFGDTMSRRSVSHPATVPEFDQYPLRQAAGQLHKAKNSKWS